MGFIQTIEIVTTRPAEVQLLTKEWAAGTEGERKAVRATFSADRDRPDTYVQLVEFFSYEDAMLNSDLPATAAFARRLQELCARPPTFRNLDVVEVFDLG